MRARSKWLRMHFLFVLYHQNTSNREIKPILKSTKDGTDKVVTATRSDSNLLWRRLLNSTTFHFIKSTIAIILCQQRQQRQQRPNSSRSLLISTPQTTAAIQYSARTTGTLPSSGPNSAVARASTDQILQRLSRCRIC